MKAGGSLALVGVFLLGVFGLAALVFSLFGDGPSPRIGSTTDLALFLDYLLIIILAMMVLTWRRA